MMKKTLFLGLVLGASFAFATPPQPSPPILKTSKRVVVTPEIAPSFRVVGNGCEKGYVYDEWGAYEICSPYEDVILTGRKVYIKGYDVRCRRRWGGFIRRCRAVPRHYELVVPTLDANRWVVGHPGIIISR